MGSVCEKEKNGNITWGQTKFFSLKFSDNIRVFRTNGFLQIIYVFINTDCNIIPQYLRHLIKFITIKYFLITLSVFCHYPILNHASHRKKVLINHKGTKLCTNNFIKLSSWVQELSIIFYLVWVILVFIPITRSKFKQNSFLTVYLLDIKIKF